MILFSTLIQHSYFKGSENGELEIIQEKLDIKKDRETVLVNAHKVQGRWVWHTIFFLWTNGVWMKRSGLDPFALFFLQENGLKRTMIRMTIKNDVQ